MSDPTQSLETENPLPSFWLAWTIVPLLIGPIVFVAVTSIGCLVSSHCRVSFSYLGGNFHSIYVFGVAPAFLFGLPLSWRMRKSTRSYVWFGLLGALLGLAAGAALGGLGGLAIGATGQAPWSGLGIGIFLFSELSVPVGFVWALLWRAVAGRALPKNSPEGAVPRLLACSLVAVALAWLAATAISIFIRTAMPMSMGLSSPEAAVFVPLHDALSGISSSSVLAIALVATLAWFNIKRQRTWIGVAAIGGVAAGTQTYLAALNSGNSVLPGTLVLSLIFCTGFAVGFSLLVRRLWLATLDGLASRCVSI